MASGHTGNVVPRKGLWVRVPCPPLNERKSPTTSCGALFVDERIVPIVELALGLIALLNVPQPSGE